MKKLMVIDGNSIVNRAFYGVSQNLTTREGQPTNAIFGFLNILNKLLDDSQYTNARMVEDQEAWDETAKTIGTMWQEEVVAYAK